MIWNGKSNIDRKKMFVSFSCGPFFQLDFIHNLISIDSVACSRLMLSFFDMLTEYKRQKDNAPIPKVLSQKPPPIFFIRNKSPEKMFKKWVYRTESHFDESDLQFPFKIAINHLKMSFQTDSMKKRTFRALNNWSRPYRKAFEPNC